MRPLLALILAMAILAGMQWFLAAGRSTVAENAVRAEIAAIGDFQLEVLLLFDAGPDVFSGDSNAASLLVEYQGKEVLRKTESLAAGTRLLPRVEGLVVGMNELYVSATPEDPAARVPGAIRIRILRDGIALAKSWIDGEPGERVEGTCTVVIPGQPTDSPEGTRLSTDPATDDTKKDT